MSLLEQALGRELIESADAHLADYLLDLDPEAPEELGLVAAMASAQVRRGNVCLPLDGRGPLAEAGIEVDPQRLAASSLVGEPGERDRPLILDDGRLYLARYHAWEQQVIGRLQQLLEAPPPALDRGLLRRGLERLFASSQHAPDWQRVAAALAVSRRFCIISGGPGTGKTWTVARILELLLEQPTSRPLRVVLAAPTGKAAARLSDAIEEANPALLEQVDRAQTLHRLLGMRPGRVRPRHGADNPLPLDLLIVDEVSMVDLPMMARLLAALPEEGRLILLGDRHQLASVEAGRIMADLCGAGGRSYSRAVAEEIHELTGDELPRASETVPTMADHVVVLQHSRRFQSQRGIGQLAEAINRGDSRATRQALLGEDPQLEWRDSRPQTLDGILRQRMLPLFQRVRSAGTPAEALALLDELRLLCALHDGPQGARTLNRNVERMLGVERDRLYHGKPVMVVVNDYEQQLFNGDIGLAWRNEDGELRIFFTGSDNELRSITPARLPRHETVYAMTIHKSQGSEFDEVVLVLPEQESPVCTRELLYTGITRARLKVTLCASEAALEYAIGRQVERYSGLHPALWEN